MKAKRDLEGKVVLITGAARGIGEATARNVAARGARVAAVGMEPERLERLVAELGSGHAWFECDVTDQPSLVRAVEETVAQLGGIDVVVANAGIASTGTVAVAPIEALVRVIDVNLSGVIRTVSATLPHVTARRGYYLLVSSASAIAALPGMATYAASKAAVEHFSRAFRAEVAHRGVAVGVALPSWIDTDLVRAAREDLPSFDETLKKMPGPFGRTTTVEACAEAFGDAIAARTPRVFVPSSLAPVAAMRTLFWSGLGDRLSAKAAEKQVPAFEAEMKKLGRFFGKHSVAEKRVSGQPKRDLT